MRETGPTPDLLAPWLAAERPGPDTLAGHVLRTGIGASWVGDGCVLVECAGNYLAAGDPAGFDAGLVTGFLAAPDGFAPADAAPWKRVVLHRASPACGVSDPRVRPIGPDDADGIAALNPDCGWISATWGGPAGLAASGHAYGAFDGDRLVSVACTFFIGVRHEEIGIVTEPDHRGRGLSTACVEALCADIAARGHVPCWTTTPTNTGSLRVAAKAGFEWVRDDVLWAIGVEIPGP